MVEMDKAAAVGSAGAEGMVLSTGLLRVVATTVVGAGVAAAAAVACNGAAAAAAAVAAPAAILAVLATICETAVPGARLSRLLAAETGMVMYLVVTPAALPAVVEAVAAATPAACEVVSVFRTVAALPA